MPRDPQGRLTVPRMLAMISMLTLLCNEVHAADFVPAAAPQSLMSAASLDGTSHSGSYLILSTPLVGRQAEPAASILGLGAQWSIAQLSRQDLRIGPLKDVRFGAQLDTYENLKRWRYGLGFDFDLPASGQMHFNLYSRRNPSHEGSRFRFSLPGVPADFTPRLWSLGLSVDRVHEFTRLELTPQFVLHLDSALGVPGPMVLTVQYAYVNPGTEKDELPERVVQAVLRWRF